ARLLVLCVLPAEAREVAVSPTDGAEAGNISVQCQYKIPEYAAVSKAWCKKEMGKPCNVLATTSPDPPEGQEPAREGGVHIQDDPKQGIVTVTMEQLQAQDSGVYWCALQEPSGLSRIEEIRINVSRGEYGPARCL
uniref:Ig-like domain-containing protein n=1 Tax=Malurus cyaneus samueli TaxID=2593467 RepID=A0A8C5X8W7_9PASS